MGKSTLIKILRQAYRVAQFSRKSGIPPAEVLDNLKQSISRRRLLQGSLALAGASAATTFRRNHQEAVAQPGISPVLIVGAGIAGLTAAYFLRQAGVPVNVIEARNRVGGRILSSPNVTGTNLVADLGGEFINTTHFLFRRLARELGLNLVDLLAAQEGLIEETYFFEGRRVPIAEILQNFVPVAQQIDADLLTLENFVSYRTPDPAAQALDALSITQYLERIPTDPTLQKLIEVAYTIEFGLDAQEQSSLNLLFYIGTETDEFNLFGISDERFYTDGGNGQIPNGLANLLNNSVETGTILESLSSTPNGRYRVALRSGSSTVDRTYERVLLTVPFSVLRNVQLNVNLPPAKRLAIDTVGYGTNSKLITGYTEKVWQTRYNSRANVITDLGFQNTWETSQSRFTPTAAGLITNYTGGSQGVAIGTATPEIQAQTFVSQFEQVFPGISATRIPGEALRAYWTGQLYSRGSYLCYRVGQWTQFYGVEGERVGNLFFAGEHCSYEYQGFMEGGCRTGAITAVNILRDLGLQASATQQSMLSGIPLSNEGFRPFSRQTRQLQRQQLQQLR